MSPARILNQLFPWTTTSEARRNEMFSKTFFNLAKILVLTKYLKFIVANKSQRVGRPLNVSELHSPTRAPPSRCKANRESPAAVSAVEY